MTDQITQPPNYEAVNILGVNVGTLSIQAVIDYILDSIETGERAVLAYVNIHTINLAQKHLWFRQYLNQVSITYCDGYGIKLGARLLGYKIQERYTPPDWLPKLISLCTEKSYRIYLLGARQGIAEKAAQVLRENYPGVCIAGTHNGYFDKTIGSGESEEVIGRINDLDVDILILGFGMPAQEQWLTENWSKLECRVALPVGAAIDYLAGEIPRAPHWLTDHGLEWLGRLFIEPKRLWRRYLIGIPYFFYKIILQKYGFYPQD
jgi:N-acetylglucosaminyldiphosphoundecaprenol N-acetyl-beta-D-mannosaminyltransferase